MSYPRYSQTVVLLIYCCNVHGLVTCSTVQIISDVKSSKSLIVLLSDTQTAMVSSPASENLGSSLDRHLPMTKGFDSWL